MNYPTLDNLNIEGKKVLLRIDINAAVSDGIIQDAPRFSQSAKTIKELQKKKAKVTIIAHQGRKGDSDFLSLEQHARILSEYTKTPIEYIDSLFEEPASNAIQNLQPSQAILLKNVREYDNEKNLQDQNNHYIEFCKQFDLFVNDAFSVSHREQGSIIFPPKFLPSFIGMSMQKEIEALSNFHLQNKRGLFFIGGSKIEDYLPLFDVLKEKNNNLVASGLLANLFLLAQGTLLTYEENWLKEKGYLKLLPTIQQLYKKYSTQIVLPIDLATGDEKREEYSIKKFPSDKKIWDVGKKSISLYKKRLQKADLVFLKGPLGFSENPLFAVATVQILKEISKLTHQKKLFSILGGGHLTTTLQKYKIPDNFSYISLSGGALIAYISGKKLPGLEAIEQCPYRNKTI